MSPKYATLWDRACSLRSDPKAFVAAYLELQAEVEAEARETLSVHLERTLDALEREFDAHDRWSRS